MSRELKFFWTGIALYTVSYFLMATAASPPESGLPGFSCAWLCLVAAPATALRFGASELAKQPALYCSATLAGLTNPVFLVAAFLRLAGIMPRAASVLRITTLCLIPFGWLAAFLFGEIPREGNFVWIAGMVLALYSDDI